MAYCQSLLLYGSADARDRARALLENPDAPVSDVGESAGFESPYHFSRAFRAREGVSPSEYRRRARQGG